MVGIREAYVHHGGYQGSVYTTGCSMGAGIPLGAVGERVYHGGCTREGVYHGRCTREGVYHGGCTREGVPGRVYQGGCTREGVPGYIYPGMEGSVYPAIHPCSHR